jgi:hypothetical protein
MKKSSCLVFALLFAAAWAYSATSIQDAVFSVVNGKVEYQAQGAQWKPARVGDHVTKGTVISTGFKSNAVIKVGPTSISLKPVTRLTLEELIKTEGGTQTSLYLLAGRVNADVPPQAGETTEFKVTSPTATASVRGTKFEFDGVNLVVDRGTVVLATPTSQSRKVSVGEYSYVARGNSVAAPAAVVQGATLDSIRVLVEQSAAESLAPKAETINTNAVFFNLSIDVQ